MSEVHRFENFIRGKIREKSTQKPNYTLVNRYDKICGSMYLSPNEEQEFMDLYSQVVIDKGYKAGFNCINQVPTEVRPLVIDLDLKEKIRTTVAYNQYRICTRHVIKTVIGKIAKIARESLDFAGKKSFDLFVMPRPFASKIGAKADKSDVTLKDGLHVICPDILVNDESSVHIHACLEKELSDELPHLFYEESPIDYNIAAKPSGWMMYGSAKDGNYPYLVTDIMRVSVESGEMSNILREVPKETYISRLNMRKLSGVSPTSTKNGIVLDKGPAKIPANPGKNATKSRESPRVPRKFSGRSPEPIFGDDNADISEDQLKLIRQRLDKLPAKYYSEYLYWRTIGLKLASVSRHGRKTFEVWMNFSRKWPKFDERANASCISLWNAAQDGYCGMDSLLSDISETSEQYTELLQDVCVTDLGKRYKNITDKDLAEIIATLSKSKFVIDHDRNIEKYFQFRGHVWEEMKSAVTFNRYCMDTMQSVLDKKVKLSSGIMTNIHSDNKEVNSAFATIQTIRRKMGTHRQLTAVAKYTSLYLTDDTHMERLNQNHELIAFRNGIFDLQVGYFRNGMPEDMLSIRLNYDFRRYDPTTQEARELNKFFKDIIPNAAIREFFLDYVASSLRGNTSDSRTLILYGVGANGKSCMVSLLERTFQLVQGFFASLDIKVFTGKERMAGDTNSELAKLRNKRLAVTSEIKDGARLNKAIFKDLTGNNTLAVRDLYQTAEVGVFRLVLRLIWQVNNISCFNDVSPAFRRRVRIIPFESRFLHREQYEKKIKSCTEEQKKYIKQLDPNIQRKVSGWAPTFMSMLIDRYCRLLHKGHHIVVPDVPEIINYTNDCIEKNNIAFTFLKERIVRSRNTTLDVAECYQKFSTWYMEFNHTRECAISRYDFKQAMRSLLEIDSNLPKKIEGYYLNDIY